jgi:hypothetical protein
MAFLSSVDGRRLRACACLIFNNRRVLLTCRGAKQGCTRRFVEADGRNGTISGIVRSRAVMCGRLSDATCTWVRKVFDPGAEGVSAGAMGVGSTTMHAIDVVVDGGVCGSR